jgi:hypothetical protein
VCLAIDRGALIAIRRAPFQASDFVHAAHAIEGAYAGHPNGLVMLIGFRLDPRFPLDPGIDDVEHLSGALKSFDRALRAVATVLEFGGVRAAAMRVTTRALWAMARPRCEHAMFERVTDAALWLAPRAEAIGAPYELATYVHGYKAVDAALREHDPPTSLRP